ncbi:MAG: hypothetical protein KGY69_17135 [Bacteroidales bacterium]|nr:hypothetical protein [Bacteroidales bacterium]
MKYSIVPTIYLYFLLIPMMLFFSGSVNGQDSAKCFSGNRFHLTATPWEPLNISPQAYLDDVEGLCQVARKYQDDRGAIIDPYLQREHQYSTPYYAFAVGTLLDAGRANDLKTSGVKAMDHATGCFAGGSDSIPDAHGEFFIPALTGALHLYKDRVSKELWEKWQGRMQNPLSEVMRNFSGRLNNWRTYAMKGEWMRAHADLVEKQSAVDFIEKAWKQWTQRERIVLDKCHLYQDWSSDPQSHAVEAVGRGNLTSLVMEGYDGPSAQEILSTVRDGSLTSLLLQSPAGQCPPNGRTDNHIFNDILYQLIFEAMANDALERGKTFLAGQYKRAAMLGFQSIQRWKRTEEPWTGSFYITKNHFEPKHRIGYQPASQWGNYSGTMMYHLAEAYLTAKDSNIREKPAPSEIGGYAITTDARFSTFVANAGGMQVFVNLRGASVPKYGIYWTPLGTVRFSKSGWDDRLGPSDGIRDPEAGEKINFSRGSGETADQYRAQSGVSFGPSWKERGAKLNIADLALHYRGSVNVNFVHPLLVKFTITYSYITGRGGPYFHHEFTVTPDGVLTRLSSPQDRPFALTVPLLQNDGRKLQTKIMEGIASTRYPHDTDEQNFISLNEQVGIDTSGSPIQSTYGWLKPVRYSAQEDTNIVYVYPRTGKDPSADAVKKSFQFNKNGYENLLHSVSGTIYKGRTSAGGFGSEIDLDEDGKPEVIFDKSCKFILQLRQNNRIKSVETDRNVTMQIRGEEYRLKAFEPYEL